MTLDSLGVTWLMIEVEDRRALVGDGGHPHRHVVGLERDIAVALAERRLGLELLRVDQPLDDDLRRGGHVEVDSNGLRHLDREAGERTGDAELIEIDGELLRPREHDHGRAADHDRDRHRLPSLAILEPMQIAAGAARLPRHHAHHQSVGRFQRRPIGAHVLDPAVGVAGDAERGREVGRGIEAGRRDRHRQPAPARLAPCRRMPSGRRR